MKKINQARIGLISVMFFLFFAACQNRDSRIIGIKIYNHKGSYNELISQWRSIGINTLFTSLSLYSDKEFRSVTKKNGIASYVIIPIFFNPEILDVFPEYYAITDKGEKAEEDWVQFVCPSRGVILWSWEQLEQDPVKLKIFQSVLAR